MARKKVEQGLEIKTQYTEEGYYLFNQVNYKFLLRKRKWWFLLFLVLSIPIIVACLFSDIGKSYPVAIFFVLLDIMIVIEILTNVLPNLQVKRMLKGNPELLELENTYTFLEDHFKVQNKYGENEIPYTEVTHVIEAEDYLYIYISKVGAFLVSTAKLKKKEKEDLQKKFQTLLGKKYYPQQKR